MNNRIAESAQNVSKNDLIYRKAALDVLENAARQLNVSQPYHDGLRAGYIDSARLILSLPASNPTLYGYDIRDLVLIASILQKEDLPPERVKEALTDISRIVTIIEDEFQDGLRRAFERCKEGQVQVFPNEDSNRSN